VDLVRRFPSEFKAQLRNAAAADAELMASAPAPREDEDLDADDDAAAAAAAAGDRPAQTRPLSAAIRELLGL